MSLETRSMPISSIKAHSAEATGELADGAPPVVFTQNEETNPVLQDMPNHAEALELPALQQLLTMARGDITVGHGQPLEGLKERIRGRAAR